MLRKLGGSSSTSPHEMPCYKLSFSTRPWALVWAHTDAEIGEWLLGGLALEIRQRLLRELKRDEGKEQPPFVRT